MSPGSTHRVDSREIEKSCGQGDERGWAAGSVFARCEPLTSLLRHRTLDKPSKELTMPTAGPKCLCLLCTIFRWRFVVGTCAKKQLRRAESLGLSLEKTIPLAINLSATLNAGSIGVGLPSNWLNCPSTNNLSGAFETRGSKLIRYL